ncbi:unnamed protein product [Orchesella dallaii]|uniref:Uncharacterized protein n=1 Tax=Orchesella dallaii TaxID=48710 RepID=A0ABP1S5G8_9HEXA
MKRRYVISIYVVDDSWQLTDNEWLFVLDKKREFFKDLTKWYSRNCESKRRGTDRNFGDDHLQPFDEEGTLAGHLQGGEHGHGQDLELTNTELIGPTSQPSESTDKPKEKEKADFVSNKRKKTRADKSLKEKIEKDKEREKKKEDNEKIDGGDSKEAAQSELARHTPDQIPAAPPPTPYPAINTVSSMTVPVSPVEPLDEGKIRRRGSGNLLIKYGGRQSQDIKQMDKPYWILEVLLDANVKYKMKSNRHQFRKKFLRAQESWTKECTANQEPGTGVEKPVDEIANPNIQAEIANMYECLCPEDEDYNGFTDQGFMNPPCCYKKGESQGKKTHGSNSDEGDEEDHTHDEPTVPHELGEGVLAFERRQTADGTGYDKTEKQKKPKLPASKSKFAEGSGLKKKGTDLVMTDKPGTGGNKNKKLKAAHSVVKSEEDNIEKEPSLPITVNLEELPPPPLETVEEETKPEEPENPLTEKEATRMKRCGVVGEILKCYAELFMQTIPVREELLEMVKKNQLETKGPKKLVLTKTGVGKYCEKLFHMDKKKKTKEAIVAEKLLKWAFEYFCLQPTEESSDFIEEDNGEKVTLFLH